MKVSIRAAAMALAGLALSTIAIAQDYPNRPVTMIVPYPAGGVTDGMARIMGERMQANLGQTVIVENVGGAAGSIGAGRVARGTPDGYIFLLGNLESNLTNSVSQPQINYDVVKDFEPIALGPSYPFIIVSKNDVPAKTLGELNAWLKANQATAFQGTVGAGTTQHLCGVRMQERIGAKWSFIPYRGGAPAMQDLVAGRYDVMCTATGSFLPLVRNNQIRAYAITAKTRLEAAPEIPTVDEAGMPGFYVSVWNAMFAPRGTPKPIVERLAKAAAFAMNDPGARKKIIDMGLDLPPADLMTPDGLAKYQASEGETWLPIMRSIKDQIKPN